MNNAKNILIVDDDIHLRDALKYALERESFQISKSGSKEECLIRLMQEVPDLILLDVVLPDVNGVDLAKEILNNPLYASASIILMSGRKTQNSSIKEGIKSGALHFLPKPIDIQELIQLINLVFRVKDLENKRLHIEHSYNHLLLNANDLLFILDEKYRILSLSKSFETVCGLEVPSKIGSLFVELISDESKKIWTTSAKKTLNDETLPPFDLFLLNTFNNQIPVNVQLTKTQQNEQGAVSLIGIAKDLRTIKLLEAQTNDFETNDTKNLREISSWESMSFSNTSLTEYAYEVSALADSKSEIFGNMLKAYQQLIESAIEQRIYKVEIDQKYKQRMFANELGFLKAGPKELVKLHTTFYQNLNSNINAKQAAIYHEEARIILLTVMGYLVSFYRNRNSQKS